jgi:hypothetical protein
MPQELMSRTNAGLISANLISDRNPPVVPVGFSKIQPHTIERQSISPSTGTIAPGGEVMFRIRKTGGDFVRRIKVVFKARELWTLDSGVGLANKKIRYMDWLGIGCVEYFVLKYGPHTHQRILPEEVFTYIEATYDDEEKSSAFRMMRGNMSVDQRIALCEKAQKVEVHIPTAFFSQVESNALFVPGLTTEYELYVKFKDANTIIQANSAAPNSTTSNSLANSATTWFTEASLNVEYMHVLEGYRNNLVAAYRSDKGIRYLFDEFQYYNETVGSATALGSTAVQIQIRGGINEPVKYLAIMLRWVKDLQRTAPTTALGNRELGRDLFNVDSWWSPEGNTASNIFSKIRISAGNNQTVFEETDLEEVLFDTRGRHFEGSVGSALILLPLSLAPTAKNAVTGMVDFSLLDTPTVHLTPNSDCGYADLAAAATGAIGESSDLYVTIIGVAHNFVDAIGSDMHKQFN